MLLPIDDEERGKCTGIVNHQENSVMRGRSFQTLSGLALKLWAQRTKLATGAAAVLAVTMGYHVVFGHNGLIVYSQKKEEARRLGAQLDDLRRENGQLKDHTQRLESDPNAIEHQAREELHYTRPGEVIYTLPPDPAKSSSAGTTTKQ
jgi:cell division protein FtsB